MKSLIKFTLLFVMLIGASGAGCEKNAKTCVHPERYSTTEERCVSKYED